MLSIALRDLSVTMKGGIIFRMKNLYILGLSDTVT